MDIDLVFDELLSLTNRLPPKLEVLSLGSCCVKFGVEEKNFEELQIQVFDPITNGVLLTAKSTSNTCYISGLGSAKTYKFKCRLKVKLNQYTDFSEEMELQMLSGMYFYIINKDIMLSNINRT